MRLKVYKLGLSSFFTMLIIKFFQTKARIFSLLFFAPFFIFGQSVIASDFGFNLKDNKKALYQAIRHNDTIVIDKQSVDWFVSPMTLRNLENKTIIFEKGVVLKAKPGAFAKTSDCLLKLVNCKNFKIIGNDAVLLMNKDEYTDGEWRMGISLMGCKSIEIQDLTISGSGGDGIYIDGYKDIRYSEQIFINDIISTNNKRQGISIISAKDVWVKHSVFTETKGTLPEAGLDIEPDDESDAIINVNFEHCSFTNNHHSGIVLGLDNLTDESEPVSISFKNCYLSMNHDEANRYPAAEIIVSSNSENPVKGKVVFNDIVVEGSEWGLIYSRKPSEAYKVDFKNLTARNICQKKDGMSVVYLEVPDYYKSSGPLGGFSFEDVFVEFNTKSSFFTIRGSSLGTLNGVKDVTGNITILNPNLVELIEYIKYNPNKNNNFDVKFTLLNGD